MARPLIGALAAGLLAAALGAVPGAAQQRFRVEVSAGTQVRLAPLAGPRLRGAVVAMRGDTIVVEVDRDRPPVPLALGALRALEVRAGRDRGAGALRGAAVLALVAAVAGAIDGVPGDEWASGVLGNAVAGAGVGALLAPRGWLRVPLPPP